MSEKIFRGFWRYRYLSWILSAVHQSHTSIFNGLTLHLSPKSESDPLLFRKVLILEEKTFSVLQEVSGKAVLRQSSPPPLGAAAAVLAARGRFLLPAQLDTLPRDPLSLRAPAPVSQPAQGVLVQKKWGVKSGTGEQGTKAWNAQAWLPAALLVFLWCWPAASF